MDSLIYRDADHYLSGRTLEFSLHTKKDDRGQPIIGSDGHAEILEEEPTWKSGAFPAISLGYEVIKVLSFQKQLIFGGKNPLAYNTANAPSQVGGVEWSMLGYEHFKHWDADKEKNIEEPNRLDPVSAVDLQRFLPQSDSSQR